MLKLFDRASQSAHPAQRCMSDDSAQSQSPNLSATRKAPIGLGTGVGIGVYCPQVRSSLTVAQTHLHEHSVCDEGRHAFRPVSVSPQLTLSPKTWVAEAVASIVDPSHVDPTFRLVQGRLPDIGRLDAYLAARPWPRCPPGTVHPVVNGACAKDHGLLRSTAISSRGASDRASTSHRWFE